MISSNTPSGAEVVCIDASAGPYGPCGLTQGAIYTVERIETALYGRHVVLLVERPLTQVYEPPWGLVTVGYELRRFRYLDIPDSLIALLHDKRTAMEGVSGP